MAKKVTAPKKRGRKPYIPSARDIKIVEEGYAKKLTDTIIIEQIGIKRNTFYNWKDKSEFANAIKRGSDRWDAEIIQTVEDNLKKLADGYEYDEVTIIETRNPKTGELEVSKRSVIKKRLAPNAGVLYFLACNKGRYESINKTEISGSLDVKQELKTLADNVIKKDLGKK